MGNAVPAQAAQFTVTYQNGLSLSTAAPAPEQTDADGELTVNNTQLTHNNNTFIFLGWSEYDFNGFPAGSSPTIYGTSSVANSASLTATGNMTLKAAWSQPITQLQMSNPTEIPIWYSNVYNLDSASPLPSDFTVTVDGSPVTVSSFTGNKIVLANALTSIQQQVRVSWTPAVGRRLVSDSDFGYVIPGFTNVGVTTNSIQFPPTLSNATTSSTTHQGTSVSVSSNFNGDLRYVVKLSTSDAPDSAEDLADGIYGSEVVVSSGSFANSVSNGTRTFMISGLSASTSYKIWLAGKNNQFNTYSNMVVADFTTTAPPAAPTFSGTPNVGQTLTASASGGWYYCATSHPSGSLDFDCRPIIGMMGLTTGSSIVIPEISSGVTPTNLVGKHITVVVGGQAAATQLIGAASGSNNNQNNNQFQPTPCAGQTGLTNVTLSVATLTRTGTYKRIYNDDATLNNCYLPSMALSLATYVNGELQGTISGYSGIGLGAFTADRTLTSIETTLGRQLAVGDVITFKYWSGVSSAVSAANLAPTFAPTLTIIGESESSTDVTDPSIDATDTAVAPPAPLPVWASNIVASIPTLTKSLVTTGGSVSLTGGDYADLKSVTIGGKAVDFKIETTGNVSIPVPAGEVGKTADIVIVFGGGTMTVVDGIKYVAQVDVAKVAERPIAIAAGKRITGAIAEQIRQAALANMKNTQIQCVAYAAANTAKAKATAQLSAVQACGIAAKANPSLKIADVSVVVDKVRARLTSVGIKVYKLN
jgi:hypothetical protein